MQGVCRAVQKAAKAFRTGSSPERASAPGGSAVYWYVTINCGWFAAVALFEE